MKNITISIFLVFGMLIAFAIPVMAQYDQNWKGQLDVNGVQLELILKIEKKADLYEAYLDIEAQGAKDLKANKVSVEDDAIMIEWADLGFGIGGSLDKNGNLDALFSQGAFSNSILFTPAQEIKLLDRPQTPRPKFEYLIEEVSFVNSLENIKLAGTLTLPKGIKNPPIAVMISGSGQQDRDETIMEHKPFWVIADYFAKNGIGVLRYDDRGVGGSEKGKDIENATSLDFGNDAAAAISYLRTKGYTNIGVVGHSEGGMIAPMLAAQDAKIKFIILLAGPGISGADVLIGQSYAASNPMEQEVMAHFNQGLVEVAVAGIIADKKYGAIEEDLEAYLKRTEIGASMDYDLRKKTIQQIAATFTRKWMQYFIKHDPAAYLSKVKCPVLALNGSKDVQVLAKENLLGIEQALKNGVNNNYTVKEIEGLNHLFQPATTGMVDEYEKITTTFDPATITLMKDWILKLKLK